MCCDDNHSIISPGCIVSVVPVVDSSDADKQSEVQDEEEDEEEGSAPGEGGVIPASLGKHSVVWYMKDNKWNVPKVNVTVSLESMYATATPLNVTMTEMLSKCLKEILNEYSYYADCAGRLHFSH